MIAPELRTKIRALFFAEHWKIGTIATQLGVHHEAVRLAVEANRFANAPTRLCHSQLDPFKPFITQTLAQYPRLRATRLLDMLRPRGYAGGVGILRTHVRTIRRAARHEAFLRLHTLPGEQAQVDWGAFGTIRIGHAPRSRMCFVRVLSYSRAVFARFDLDARMDSFLEGHVAAFEAFGGAPRKLLYDHLKSAVLERVGDPIRFHPRLLELAGHYHCVPQPCAPYRGHEKGKVERTIRYLRDGFFAARRDRDLDDLNAQLADWITRVADARKVPGDAAGTLVADARAHERAHLVPRPAHRFPTEIVTALASGKTPYVRFDRNDDSIPHTLVRKPWTLVASRTLVRGLDGTTEVARPVRSFDAGQRIEQASHLDALGRAKRQAHELRGRDRLRSVCPAAEAFFKTLAERGHSLARPAVRLGQLLDPYGAEALERALRDALDRGSVSAESVASLLTQRAHRRAATPPVDVPLPPDPRLRVRVQPHALSAYDRLGEPSERESPDE
jgi:transposase